MNTHTAQIESVVTAQVGVFFTFSVYFFTTHTREDADVI